MPTKAAKYDVEITNRIIVYNRENFFFSFLETKDLEFSNILLVCIYGSNFQIRGIVEGGVTFWQVLNGE